MSASLIVLIPILLLGLVTTLCFVGCALDTQGIPADNGPYENAIFNDPNLIAFWPLNDPPSPDTSSPPAADIASHPPAQMHFNGTYTGSFTLQQAGIVPGDVQNMVPSFCASFNGGRVEVPFHVELNGAPFTVEGWVQRAWPDTDVNVHSVVVTTDLDPAANSGYALFCDETNMWTAAIGLGPGANPTFKLTTPDAASQPAAMGTTFYLALTFDGTTLLLFVNSIGSPFNMTPYAKLALDPTDKFATSGGNLPLFIGGGRPDLPTSMLLPFIGKIQDVAFYKAALSAPQLQGHFALGNPG